MPTYIVLIRFTEQGMASIREAPDDLTQAKLALALGGRGNSRSETLRAFTEEEFRQIVADLP